MADASAEFARQGDAAWFVVPRPRRPFRSGSGRPVVLDLLAGAGAGAGADARPRVVEPPVGRSFELGTQAFRARLYERSIRDSIPAGTPLIVSNDPAVWSAAARCADSHPMIGVLHGDDPAYYELASRYSASLSGLISVSKRISNRARDRLEFAMLPVVRTIPCGVPLPAWSAVREPHSATLRVIWIGRMEEREKRISDLPKILGRLEQNDFPYELDLIGDGPDRASLEREFRAAALQCGIRWHGWRTPDEIAQFLSTADVLLLPSNTEGMPLSVMEAFAAGCGVVASRTSGIENYEHHPLAQGCLWVHAIGDVDAAARCVTLLAVESRAVLAQRARLLAEREFAIEVCVARYREALAAVREMPRRSRAERTIGDRAGLAASYPIAAWRALRTRDV